VPGQPRHQALPRRARPRLPPHHPRRPSPLTCDCPDAEWEHEQKKELDERARQTSAQRYGLILVIAIAVLCGVVVLLPNSADPSADKAWVAWR
jgi:hypothetical protein